MNNFFIVLLDGVGIGELPDAALYNDQGSHTLGNISKEVGGLVLPNLTRMGLGNIDPQVNMQRADRPQCSFGKMAELSKGKDSTTGHWEIGGLEVKFDFPYYPDGFPPEIINKFLELTGFKGVLGNCAASGTEIIMQLGDEHLSTGLPIVYTSADSVFQVAAHEEVIPLDRLYEICKIAREQVFTGKDSIGRIIARPFLGTSGNYARTTNRKDYSLNPCGDTIFDCLGRDGIETVAVGKVGELFNFKGIQTLEKTRSNLEGAKKLVELAKRKKNSFIFANLVDFDVYYGHRNDTPGFYMALKQFDELLPELLSQLDNTDALIITADHGNDPTTPSTDHSREYVPLLFYRKGLPGRDLGTRSTFSDIAKTAAEFFGVENNLNGISFLYI